MNTLRTVLSKLLGQSAEQESLLPPMEMASDFFETYNLAFLEYVIRLVHESIAASPPYIALNAECNAIHDAITTIHSEETLAAAKRLSLETIIKSDDQNDITKIVETLKYTGCRVVWSEQQIQTSDAVHKLQLIQHLLSTFVKTLPVATVGRDKPTLFVAREDNTTLTNENAKLLCASSWITRFTLILEAIKTHIQANMIHRMTTFTLDPVLKAEVERLEGKGFHAVYAGQKPIILPDKNISVRHWTIMLPTLSTSAEDIH